MLILLPPEIYKAFVLRIESKIFIKSKKIKFQKNRNLASNFHIVEDGFQVMVRNT